MAFHIFPPISSLRKIVKRRQNKFFPLSLMLMLIMLIYITAWLRCDPEVVFLLFYYPLYRRIVMFLTSLLATAEYPQDPFQVHCGRNYESECRKWLSRACLSRHWKEQIYICVKEKRVCSTNKNPLRCVLITSNSSNTWGYNNWSLGGRIVYQVLLN